MSNKNMGTPVKTVRKASIDFFEECK